MKIYALPSHLTKTRTSGVDLARVIQPMKYLNGYKGITTEIYDAKEEKHNDPKDWFDVMKNNDIFYFNYLHNPWGFAAMGMVARKEGVKLVMDIDDAIWHLHTDNPAYRVYGRGTPGIGNFTSICNEVDYITCTNDYLKHVIMNNTNKRADQVGVFPNYIDLKLYEHRSPFKDDGQIKLLHFGSSTHGYDLDDHQFFRGVDRIMKEYPNATFRNVSGTFLPKFSEAWGRRYDAPYGHQDIYHWVKDKFPKFMDEADIILTPLVDDIYNRSKSSIKWLEASSAKKPGVWQDIRQYAEVIDGVNGTLAKKDTEWYHAIKDLIDNPKKRKEMGEKAFQDIQNWQIQNHLDEYAEFFEKVLINPL